MVELGPSPVLFTARATGTLRPSSAMPCSHGNPTNGQLREGRLCWWVRRGQKSPLTARGKDSLSHSSAKSAGSFTASEVWKHSLALGPVGVGWWQLSPGTCALWLLLCSWSTVLPRCASLQVILGFKRHRTLSETFHALLLHYFSPVTSKCGPTFLCLLCMHEYVYCNRFSLFFLSCDVGYLNTCQRRRTRLCLANSLAERGLDP